MSAARRDGGSGAPLPTTGHAAPQRDEVTETRCAQALESYKAFFLKYERQEAIISRINVLRLSCLGKRGVPLDGRRLSEVSQAGKSRMLRAYRDLMNSTAMPDDGKPNPYRVLYVELKGAHTLKMLCKVLLGMLGDPHPEIGNAEDVQERVRRLIEYRGVELLIVDEVQHLNGDSSNKMDITDELKLFLDAGIVPVIFAGNEKSRRFFERNDQLSARLGTPLELAPLRGVGHAARLFKTFCRDLDAALVSTDILQRSSGLDGREKLKGLMAASGGHVGRVCRIVEAALEHAVMRQAEYIEAFDLWHAVDTFAIPQRYTKANPFSS